MTQGVPGFIRRGGKTFSLDAAREAWESSGYRVLGASLAAWAAAELQNGAGIPSQTIDRLRMRRRRATSDSTTAACS